MIANFFNKTKPINTLLIVALLFVAFIFSMIVNLKESFSTVLALEYLGNFFLLLITLFLFNFIVRKNNLTKDNSHALFLFVVLLGMFPLSLLNSAIIILNVTLLLAYRRIYSLRTKKNTRGKLFDSGMWIGVAALIYPWSTLVLFLVYIATYLFDKRSWQNAFIPLVGFLTPIFIYSAYLLLLDKIYIFYELFSFDFNFNFTGFNSFRLIVPLAVVCALLLWSIFPTSYKISIVNNEFKNSWYLLIYHFFIVLLAVLPFLSKNGSELLLLFFPIAIILTNYIQIIEEKMFKEVLMYSMVIIMIIGYFL